MTVGSLFLATLSFGAPISLPPPGKLYQGFYYGGVGTDTHDPSEHDFTTADIAHYENMVGAKTSWVFFSNNWFESRQFPAETCGEVRSAGKIPYVRLMLRSDLNELHAEKTFTLDRILRGEFDGDLRAWAREAKTFGSPVLIEWGTEPNGKWFPWNGRWNGGAKIGPAKYVAVYRHMVDLMRSEGATNLQWIWHVNWLGEPESKWNAFENYYPGNEYADWIGLSAYGPTTPAMKDGTESLRFKLREAYPRLTKLAPGKPIVIAEFGCDIHNRHCDAATWAGAALDEIFSGRWPAIIGFCWWNEGWQNDDTKKHDSDLIIWHDRDLARVFRDKLEQNRAKIQESAISGMP